MSMQAYSERFDQAVALAVDAFRSKWRKAQSPDDRRIPYVTHLLSVCALVGEHGGTEDQMIAAILHDWLEDIPGASFEELEARFGPHVAELVLAMSDTTTPEDKAPWRPRKEAYLVRLRDEAPDLKLIGAADKLHNCRTLIDDVLRNGDAAFERFNAPDPKHDTLWYYRACVVALEAGWDHAILEDLRGAVADLHRAAETPL